MSNRAVNITIRILCQTNQLALEFTPEPSCRASFALDLLQPFSGGRDVRKRLEDAQNSHPTSPQPKSKPEA